MTNNQSSDSNAQRSNFALIFKKIRDLKEENENGYISLLDTSARKVKNSDDTSHVIAPIQRTTTEHLVLLNKTRQLMREYLKMKPFILDTYVISVAYNAGLKDTASQQKMRKEIALEMDENLKTMTLFSARLANETNSTLDKDLTYNELKSLTHDLSYRLESYKCHYQSYLADNNHQSKIIYS